MKLRLCNRKDFEYICKWSDNKRVHTFWLAEKISFPIVMEEFLKLVEEQYQNYGAKPYCMEDSDGIPKAFCLYLENEEQEGFIKFVAVDPEYRGYGFGTRFIKMILEHAFQKPEIKDVRLNVYDVNAAARKCYERAGFQENAYYPGKKQVGNECWGVYIMIVYREQKGETVYEEE